MKNILNKFDLETNVNKRLKYLGDDFEWYHIQSGILYNNRSRVLWGRQVVQLDTPQCVKDSGPTYFRVVVRCKIPEDTSTDVIVCSKNLPPYADYESHVMFNQCDSAVGFTGRDYNAAWILADSAREFVENSDRPFFQVDALHKYKRILPTFYTQLDWPYYPPDDLRRVSAVRMYNVKFGIWNWYAPLTDFSPFVFNCRDNVPSEERINRMEAALSWYLRKGSVWVGMPNVLPEGEKNGFQYNDVMTDEYRKKMEAPLHVSSTLEEKAFKMKTPAFTIARPQGAENSHVWREFISMISDRQAEHRMSILCGEIEPTAEASFVSAPTTQ